MSTKDGNVFWGRFSRIPIVGIIRNLAIEDVVSILPIFEAAGLTTVEITMNTPDAGDIIRYAVDQHGDSLNVGAGTVCNTRDLKEALKAGAEFIVTPVTDEDVIVTCAKREVPDFPGAFTPTEIYRAWTLGADIVKVFPATSLGPRYFREMKGPLSAVKLMPTGGVNVDNCVEFLKAGAVGLGIGSQLFDEELIRAKSAENDRTL